ncbi:sigma 54-interacting transcriptional regulator [Desulfopila aestuarii]|nr:sigma 54-interacting transcriptional regulator [Desulfopila aestuarii]
MAQFSKHAQIISQSRQMQEVFQTINKVAGTSSSVLITGESGTGKELIARAIHTSSERVQKSFVALNCASIPSELIESELFGHEKGAFTGAHNRTPGKFEFANGGTLLLDEISSLKSEFQAQLLRVLQEQEFTRVGGHRVIKVDVRIIAATNTCRLNMDGRGAWRDNIFVERLWRTVKYEQVYLHAYDSVSEARRSIMRYFDWYNRSRPHSGLNRRTPDEVYCATLPALDLAA